ncbi:MAG: hypothetical protein M3Y51_09585 [Actinomycetota bacterium]|nr:hypothetical protein [Actinomycetota bacterium]
MSRARMSRGQRGAGLIEVLIASAVMTPLILAAALGLMTGMRASASAATTQRIGVALTTATENVKAMPYLPCGTPDEYRESYERWLSEHPPTIVEAQRSPEPRFVEVTYWDERSASYTPECAEDGGAQRITVAVAVDRTAREATIVTRAPAPTRALELRR